MPSANPEVSSPSAETKTLRKINNGEELNNEIVSVLLKKGETPQSLMENRLAKTVFTHMIRKRMCVDATTETVEIAVMSVLNNQKLNKVSQ